MRLIILLILALSATATLTLFPEVADQPMRIEAFGWLFEARQGFFTIVLLAMLATLWMLQRLLKAVFSGPNQLWHSLRNGSKKRRTSALRDGVARLINMHDKRNKQLHKKAKSLFPDWAVSLLKTMSLSAIAQSLPTENDHVLSIAMAARIATDPAAGERPDLAIRKAHLQAWIEAHPGAPMAVWRLAEVAIEEKAWADAVHWLEEAGKQNYQPRNIVRRQLANSYLNLAISKPEEATTYLRKAQQLAPNHAETTLAIGENYRQRGDVEAAEKLWRNWLENHDDMQIAARLLTILQEEPLKAYRRFEHVNTTPALHWLRAELAFAADLTGLAHDEMQLLIDESPRREAWQSLGHWHAKHESWEDAAYAFQQALGFEKQIYSDHP
ncbi:MAG: hypothetical protein R8M38_05940 [Mariprofundaceae bacterium]